MPALIKSTNNPDRFILDNGVEENNYELVFNTPHNKELKTSLSVYNFNGELQEISESNGSRKTHLKRVHEIFGD